MKKLILIGFGLLALNSQAQNEKDVLRYSTNNISGTARYKSTSGAFGALGGDFSTLSSNPAGIGVYRKSEFAFTPSLSYLTTDAEHYGTTVMDYRSNMMFENLGGVFVMESSNGTGWKSSAFGIGFNRQNNYYRNVFAEGVNTESSLIDVYMNELNANGGVEVDQLYDDDSYKFGPYLAWETYLIDTLSGANYVSNMPKYGQTQQQTISSSGYNGETVFSYGGNYNDKLFIGATLGVQKISFSQTSVFTETVSDSDTSTYLNSYSLTEILKTEGTGVNFKMGFIYRANDFIRLGGAIHTPTFFNMEDVWQKDMESEFDGGFTYSAESPVGTYEYSLTTPYRANLSMAGIIGKKGLISADYEFVDYSSGRLSAKYNDYSFSKENTAVSQSLTQAHNLRIGGELRLNPFALRAGYAYSASPYDSSVGVKYSNSQISFGGGYREEHFFVDVAYVYRTRSDQFFMYDKNLVDATKLNDNLHNFAATVGFRF